MGRRIAKMVDGVITEKYLWRGLTRLLAVYDGSNNLIMRFEYADARMPVTMTKGGATYYLTYDQIGSLRIVADASGNVIRRIEYDSFGNTVNDTNPGFMIPYGFAGGLYDRDTGLVRFGCRNYDPEVGRWTAKDPIFFAGKNVDLYEYAVNNPINFVDPSGRTIIGEILLHLALAVIGTAVEGDFEELNGGEAEWLAERERERERQEYEKMVEESGIREYLEMLEAYNQRLRAIISIYENEFQIRPCL